MADSSVQLDSMSGGEDIASSEVGGKHYQVIKQTFTGIGHGVKTVTAAGTDEALAATTEIKMVTIQAQTDNTGLIAFGAAGVDATEATGTGDVLYPGDSADVYITDLASVFIDATVSGDGVRYTYYT